MPRSIALILILILLAASVLSFAQEAAEPLPHGKGTDAAVITYLSDWRLQNPPRYSVTIDSMGRITYRSEPAADPDGGSAPDPYIVKWTATLATRDKVFQLAQKANYFRGNFTSKARVADTGLKTLRYKDQGHDESTSYNYSESGAIRDLTDIFQAIETTAEMGRKLQQDARYNKLAIDEDLKILKQEQHEGSALEFGSVEVILQQLAADTSMLRMAQQHAREILRAAGLPIEK